MITIHKAISKNYPELFELIEKLLMELEEEYEHFSTINRQKVYKDLADKQHLYTILIASTENGDVIGVISLSEGFAFYAGGNYGIIDELYVLPAWRGKGIGKALVDHAKQTAKEKGWLRLDVTTPRKPAGNVQCSFMKKRVSTLPGRK